MLQYVMIAFQLGPPGQGYPVLDSTRTLLQAGRAGAAYEYVAALPDSSCDADLARVTVNLTRGRYNEAVEAAERCAAASPNASSHQFYLATAYLLKVESSRGLGRMGMVKRARQALERAVALDPDNLDAREMLLDFHAEAPGIVGGNADEARRQAAAIAARDPVRGFGGLVYLADARNDRRAVPALIARGDSLARAYPDDPRLAHYRAWLWALQGVQLDLAERTLRAYAQNPPAIPGAPTSAFAWQRLATVYEQQGREADAHEAYRKAVALRPVDDGMRDGFERTKP